MRRNPLLLALMVVLVAVNLRPAVASVGPVLPDVRADLALSGTATALLTTLPLLCFGLLALLAPRLARWAGIERVLLAALLVLVTGTVCRVLAGSGLLFTGTVLAAGAIAIGNVLLPPLIKRDFPTRTGVMMGVFSMTVSAAAAVASGATVPLGDALGHGWRGALGVWAVPAIVAALLWLPQLRARTAPDERPPAPRSLRRDPLAWQVTTFFGTQSLSFYATLAWLPSIYREHGVDAASAGFLLALSGVAQIPVALVLPALAQRASNQIAHAVLSTAAMGAGLAGLLLAPMSAPVVWVVLLGIGQGATFALGLNLFVLRTRRVEDTARLSAMAQSTGYVLCAFGPLLVGLLHEATGSWTPPLVLLLLFLVPQLVSGVLAGRDRHVAEDASPVLVASR
ncbi:MFS transporter [Umezawaea beigongshangensis]|uniref:MFS transporter n=1 Tax=Umezawaea beigongshangensis TaxID=2780383 RepID=UPI0018F189D6|nr:MFS transporter [Umezawaea beigongshangensis]